MNAVQKQPSRVAQMNESLMRRQDTVAAALPAHIPIERFMRVVMTAVQRNPDLAAANHASLFNAALLAAQDGLLPDGRDGALVIYGSQVQWMPMIAGVLKKARNSGELASIEAHLVHEKDQFSFSIGVDDVPKHSPDWFGVRGKVVGVYAFATLKNGAKQCEVMSIDQVEQVRAASKARNNGPWVSWWGEMAKKTVLRRLMKRLPTSADLDDVIRRDDALYDFDGERSQRLRAVAQPRTIADRLDALAGTGNVTPQIEAVAGDTTPAHDAETGEVFEDSQSAPAGEELPQGGKPSEERQASSSPEAPSEGAPVKPTISAADAFQLGVDSAANGVSRRAVPVEVRASRALVDSYLKGFDAAGEHGDGG